MIGGDVLRNHMLLFVMIGFMSGMMAASTALGASNVDLGAVPFGPNPVRLVEVGSLTHHIQQSAVRKGAPNKIYFGLQNGLVEQFTKNPDGTLTDDVGFLLKVPDHRSVFGNNSVGSANGLRGIAFHPDFDDSGAAGYGKFYTQHTETFGRPNPTRTLADLPTGSTSTGAGQSDSVLYEWTFNPANLAAGVQSSRQVYRVQYPFGHHNGQNIAFNPTASPDNADYGKLYMSFGDSGGTTPGGQNFSADPVTTTAPQAGSTVLGKIIRIDPLQNGANPFSIPTDNPFTSAHDPGGATLDEIWAIGFRNPQTMSFDTATGKLLVGNISHNNVEEIELIERGGNHGWSEREGVFGFATPFDSTTLTEVPLATRQSDQYTYPVAQFDHKNNLGDRAAVIGGFVYHGELAAELQGLYLLGNLSTDQIFYAHAADLINDEIPADGRAGNHPLFQLKLVDELGNPTTLGGIVGVGAGGRVNMRFGQDTDDEIYLISKHNDKIYRFEGTSIPEPAGVVMLGLGGLLMLRRRRSV